MFPALNRRKDSVIVLESTGNGNNGFYYEVCTGVRKGFEVVFLPWYVDPNYKKSGDPISPADRVYIADLMGVEEIPSNLSEDQLRWYKDTSETIGKQKCQQEYPINIEQVFQATNSSFFSIKTMQAIKIKEPLHTLSWDNNYLSIRDGGSGFVFAEVNPEYEYLMAVDPSEGQIDPTAITILDPDGNEVLYWNEKLIPTDSIKLIEALGKQYGVAEILIESNSIGQHIIAVSYTHLTLPTILLV